MKWFDKLNYISLNITGSSVTAWLLSLMNGWSNCIAVLVAMSILVMNGYKIYGIHLDNMLKKKELKTPIK